MKEEGGFFRAAAPFAIGGLSGAIATAIIGIAAFGSAVLPLPLLRVASHLARSGIQRVPEANVRREPVPRFHVTINVEQRVGGLLQRVVRVLLENRSVVALVSARTQHTLHNERHEFRLLLGE